MLENKMNQLQEAIDRIDWTEMEGIEKPVVDDVLAYSIFGDDLSIEMTIEELVEMFLFEL